jgi:hypothetical protein
MVGLRSVAGVRPFVRRLTAMNTGTQNALFKCRRNISKGTGTAQATLLWRMKQQCGDTSMRYVILWLAGVPIVGIIMLKVLGLI